MPFDSNEYYDEQHRRKEKRKRKKTRTKQRLIIFLIAFLIVASSIGLILAHYFLPNMSTGSIAEFDPLYDDEKINIMLDDGLAELKNHPVLEGEELYIPCDFLKEYVDKYLFWDKELERLTITTDNRVIRLEVDQLEYSENNNPKRLSLPILKFDSVAYMPETFVEELYNVNFEYIEDTRILLANFTDKEMKLGKIIKNTNMRFEPNIKSPIAEKLEVDSKLVVFEETEDYTKVRSESGLVGYVTTKTLEPDGVTEISIKTETEIPSAAPIDGKVTLLWDQVFNADANNNDLRRKVIPGLKVLSPTWLSFDLNSLNGDIVDLCDQSYIDRAHQNGMQVWALISDIPSERIITGNELSHLILSNGEIREHVINQLLDYVEKYNLDGINIDFESVQQVDSDNYVQFFRELYPMMKLAGAALSVDVYVPQEWSQYYQRGEVAKSVDYFCLMAYDEHYAGSKVSGPVASIGFVADGVANTMKEVPKEKILMGIPFYDRVWREETDANGEILVSSSDTYMGGAYETFRVNGANFQWLEDSKLYYGEYETLENGNPVRYRVWLEDERSIDEKLKLALDYDVKGVAFWKRGLEVEGVWDLVNSYLVE